ncbi:hypothetical protein [Mycobacterium sp. Marseille-P9652]|uniref:hypothetical protein n=1 Tax=Mycobacterium sp. Marseille-P9652 TaxID=2654950 RepID=UPI0012E8495C|nr:hypothetical protein [Mycobacterium sp. Marseille-P9652]
MARVAGVTAAAVAVVTLAACSTSVQGKAIRAPGEATVSSSATFRPAHPPVAARDLLLQNGDVTPLGPVTAAPIGDSYFTSAQPPECSAALLFENSPLRPPGLSDHAESSYRVTGSALYAEAVDRYDRDLNVHDVVWNGFRDIANCRGDAVGVAPQGQAPPLHLSLFSTGDGVLTWTMTRPDWTCDYGLAVLPRLTALLSACDAKPGFPMADWAAKRRSQIDGRTA